MNKKIAVNLIKKSLYLPRIPFLWLIRLYQKTLSPDHGWCRVFYPYGIGEHPSRLCTWLIRQIAQRQKVILKNPASTKDYLHIDDVASALLTIVESGVVGSINVGTGVGVQVKDLAAIIARLLQAPEMVGESIEAAPDPYSHVVADATKLRALGWRPQVALADGLAALVRHHTQ